MRTFLILWRREMASYFLTPIGYLSLIFFLSFMGVGFVLLVTALANGMPAVSIMRAIYGDSLFTWISLLVLVPVLTMRLVAEEKRAGTLESLLTLPLSETVLVLAKYAGALSFYLILWLPTAAFSLAVAYLSDGVRFEWLVLASSFAGLILLGMFFVALGLLASVLTRTQLVAGMMSFTMIGVFLFIGQFPYQSQSPFWQQVGRYLFAVDHMREFSWGIVDSRPVVFYLSLTSFTLLSTIRLMQAQRI